MPELTNTTRLLEFLRANLEPSANFGRTSFELAHTIRYRAGLNISPVDVHLAMAELGYEPKDTTARYFQYQVRLKPFAFILKKP